MFQVMINTVSINTADVGQIVDGNYMYEVTVIHLRVR